MRLWSQQLIPYLDRQRLLGLHRETCAIRGLGWGKKHSTVDYVFKHPPTSLIAYHIEVIIEMEKRGYCVDQNWKCYSYRGKNCEEWDLSKIDTESRIIDLNLTIYPEHNKAYLKECLENLKGKGVVIDETRIK